MLALSQLPWEYTNLCCRTQRHSGYNQNHNIHLHPLRYPFLLLREEKQCTVKCLAQGHKYTTVAARILTDILITKPS